MPPYVPFWAAERQVPLNFYFCHFSLRPVSQHILHEAVRADLQPAAMILVPAHFHRTAAPGVRRAFQEVVQVNPGKAGRPWRLEAKLIELVSQLAWFALKQHGLDEPMKLVTSHMTTDPRIVALKGRLALDPTRPWRVSELAKSLDISAGHLHYLFKKIMGMSLKEYLIELRLRHALKLLSSPLPGQLPSIKAVSQACGYSSQHFFCRQFRSHFQMTPRDYLRRDRVL